MVGAYLVFICAEEIDLDIELISQQTEFSGLSRSEGQGQQNSISFSLIDEKCREELDK